MTTDGFRASILVADEAPATVDVVRRVLRAEGWRVLAAANAADARRLLRSEPFALVLTNVRLPGAADLELVTWVRDNVENATVVAMANFASVDGAIAAMRAGACDVLVKPFEPARLLQAVADAVAEAAAGRASRRGAAVPATPAVPGLWGDSEAMRSVYKAIVKASSTAATVLVSGESGTGKELVARAIHYGSARASAPFVAVNCGAIPESLLESELFGFVKGAFTGASEARAGFFQTADGGTIFLDEISETTPSMQVKLLRVLQEKEICMVGATRPRKVDVRIVASTNRDPLLLMQRGLLREDLYYRLNVITIALPALRERGEDIPLLVRLFLRKFADEYAKPVPEIAEPALAALRAYAWPGNVRELENVLQRLVIMNESGTVTLADLPAAMRGAAPRPTDCERSLAEMTHDYVLQVLDAVGGNRSRAARILGIDRKTLRGKLLPH